MSADKGRTPWHRLADAAEVANIGIEGLMLLAAALYAAQAGREGIERVRQRCEQRRRTTGEWSTNRLAERWLRFAVARPWKDDRWAVVWTRWPVEWAERSGLSIHSDRVHTTDLDGQRLWSPERSEMCHVLRWIGDGGDCTLTGAQYRLPEMRGPEGG